MDSADITIKGAAVSVKVNAPPGTMHALVQAKSTGTLKISVKHPGGGRPSVEKDPGGGWVVIFS